MKQETIKINEKFWKDLHMHIDVALAFLLQENKINYPSRLNLFEFTRLILNERNKK